jgi:hypothetical protein
MHDRVHENQDGPHLALPRAVIAYAVMCLVALLWIILSGIVGAFGV